MRGKRRCRASLPVQHRAQPLSLRLGTKIIKRTSSIFQQRRGMWSPVQQAHLFRGCEALKGPGATHTCALHAASGSQVEGH